ncbi:MAG: hypothetical protein ABR591_13750 [Candidatus Velthaea sp.]
MTATATALWLRALHAAGARGLLPANALRLTPGELAAEVAQRGDNRLARLVDGWYYPTSYGRVRGALSDEEADRLVASLEADIMPAEAALPDVAPPVEKLPAPRLTFCQLCGFPVPPQWGEC